MATVNKDFKIKSGLIVEGTSATVNGNQVLTETASDQYIIDLIGGETLVTSVESTQMEVINGELNIKSGVFDAAGAADTAYTNAVADANAYTNGEITTALSTAQGYANDAEADAILAAQQYTDGEISDEVIARDAAILLAKNDAIADAASDATTKANQALTDANLYTDGEISTEVTNRNNAIATAKSEAISAAEGYTDGEITALEGRSQTYADNAATTAENNAKAYADGLSSGLNWKQAVNVLSTSNVNLSAGSGAWPIDGHAKPSTNYRVLLTAQSTDTENGIWVYDAIVETFSRPADADAAAELIGAAVFVMEGNNYASTAWVQADHYLTTFAGQDWTQFSGQGTYLAGNGLTLDGTTFEIDTLVTETVIGAQDKADAAETAANAYTDGRETAITTAYQGYADQAESDAISSANSYTDTREIAITSAYENYADGVALTAEQNANIYTDGKITDEVSDRNIAIGNAINALTTDDIEEGLSNLYFTDSRAKDSAVDLLTTANLTNIEILSMSGQLYITAENGVADSTTDDLAEGTTNLYFNNGRAIDAISGNLIQPEKIDIAMYRREEATQQYVASASTVNVHTLSAPYESVKYLVRVVGMDGGVKHSQITEILMTVDGNNNIAITEYGNVHTSTNPLASFSANVTAGSFNLTATTAVAGCEIIAAATMLSWAD